MRILAVGLFLLLLAGCETPITSKGVADRISASIPVDQIQYRRYVDGLASTDPFVGIWESDKGRYTLGMIADERDPIHKYKMFILDSKVSNWSPGDVKVKFKRLDWDGIAVGRYLLADKTEIGITFRSERGILLDINSEFEIMLIKTYPIETARVSGGSGTSWYVGDRLFVTNAHVVDGASEIDLMIDDERNSARVVVIDKRLDLAILRISQDVDLTPIPIGRAANLGENVTAIGYPLGRKLGTAPKVTDGILSAGSGVEDDPTRYLISAPIQLGNSGGPLFGNNGYAIGAIVSKWVSEDVDSVAFAVKSRYILPLLEELGVKAENSKAVSLSPEQLCSKYCDSVIQVQVK